MNSEKTSLSDLLRVLDQGCAPQHWADILYTYSTFARHQDIGDEDLAAFLAAQSSLGQEFGRENLIRLGIAFHKAAAQILTAPPNRNRN